MTTKATKLKKTTLKVVKDRPSATAEPTSREGAVKARDAEARDAEAFGLWIRGKTWRQIAEALDWKSHTTAGEAIARHIARTPAPEVEAIRRQSLEALSLIRAKLIEQAEGLQGYLELAKLASALVQVERRIADLVGADAPRRAEVSGPGGGPIHIQSEEDRIEWLKAARDEADRRLKLVKSS